MDPLSERSLAVSPVKDHMQQSFEDKIVLEWAVQNETVLGTFCFWSGGILCKGVIYKLVCFIMDWNNLKISLRAVVNNPCHSYSVFVIVCILIYHVRGLLAEMLEQIGTANDAKVFAVADYTAVNDDELSFRAGDQLVILRQGDEDEPLWWWAKHMTGAEGYVPPNLVAVSRTRSQTVVVQITADALNVKKPVVMSRK